MAQRTAQYPRWTHLDPALTFEILVASGLLRSTIDAARNIANNPTTLAKPLIIHSGEKADRTHLLHAIGNLAIEHDPRLRVRYYTAKEYMAHEQNAQATRRTGRWIQDCLSLGMCLVDDIEWIVGDADREETLFLTMETLANAGGAVVLSCHISPADVAWIGSIAWEFIASAERLPLRYACGG